MADAKLASGFDWKTNLGAYVSSPRPDLRKILRMNSSLSLVKRFVRWTKVSEDCKLHFWLGSGLKQEKSRRKMGLGREE